MYCTVNVCVFPFIAYSLDACNKQKYLLKIMYEIALI